MALPADADRARDSLESDDTGTLLADSESENESEVDSEDESDDGSESGAERRGGGMFDLEAADSEDDESSEEGEEDIERDESEEEEEEEEEEDEEPLFPRFVYLPAELRRRVWEFFCPEVLAVPRILEFVWDMGTKRKYMVSEGSSISNVTERARVIAAVDRETRAVALRAFPDILDLGANGAIRFNAKRDIVMLQHVRRFEATKEWKLVPRFSDRVRNLTVHWSIFLEMTDAAAVTTSAIESFYSAFPNLETVYTCCGPFSEGDKALEWVEPDKVNTYTLTTVDDAGGLMRDEERRYIWPDLVNHREFAMDNLNGPKVFGPEGVSPGPNAAAAEMWPIFELAQFDAQSVSDEDQDAEEVGDEEEWVDEGGNPFDAPTGMPAYFLGNDFEGAGEELDHGSGESDSEAYLDQYEDDFVVDDGQIEYDEDGSDPLDADSGSDDGEPGYHVPDHPGAYAVDAGPADFSDLEPDSDGSEGGRGANAKSESEEEGPSRKRARPTMISDDSDEGESDEGEEGPVRKRARRAVVSDESESSEGEEDGKATDKNEQEDDDEDDEGVVRTAPVRRRARRAVVSEDDDDE